MPTLVLNAYSKPFPLITNSIRASVFYQTDPMALLDTITKPAPHPERVWTFSGLPRNNYGFSLDEIDSGGTVLRNIALFDVVPGELEGTLNRKDEQIKVGTTPGFVDAANTATFDGTGGKPDYIGWDIVPSELTARGILALGLDYSWDKNTGVFNLLQTGDQFYAGTTWNIHFNPVSQPAGNSYPTLNDFQILLKTSAYTIKGEDFGSKIIFEPSGNYLQAMLPDIALVPQGRKLMVEVSGSYECSVEFTVFGSEVIKFGTGSLIAMNNERFSLYKYVRGGVAEWRVDDQYGNFLLCGTVVADDALPAGVFNMKLLDGAISSRYTYRRIYENYILNLPLGQVVNFDDWAIGNNKYYYSFANSLVPGMAGQFHFPDRRGLFERNTTGSNKAGDYQDNEIQKHGHTLKTSNSPSSNNTGADPVRSQIEGTINFRGNADLTGAGDKSIGTYGGTETRPKNYSINKYVLL